MKQLSGFEEELATIIDRPTELRPFVCNGSPLDCKAFLVGFNPATSMSADFWKFWQADTGFDKAAWTEAYINDRLTRPLKPGKTRRNSISNSRRVLNWILETAAPVSCLETNIYSAPSEQAVDLSLQKRLTAPFDFLLATIKPKVIVTHGADAIAHIKTLEVSAQIISVPHFSRGWSQQSAHDLGHQIKAACA